MKPKAVKIYASVEFRRIMKKDKDVKSSTSQSTSKYINIKGKKLEPLKTAGNMSQFKEVSWQNVKRLEIVYIKDRCPLRKQNFMDGPFTVSSKEDTLLKEGKSTTFLWNDSIYRMIV